MTGENQTAREMIQAVRASLKTAMESLNAERQRREEVEKKLKDQLDKAEKARVEAEEANTSKTAFLTALSHELRTPLNALLGYSDFLTEGLKGPLNPAQLNLVERIHQSGDVLLSLIEDILIHAKIEIGTYQHEVHWIKVRQAVQTAVDMLEVRFHKTGLTCKLEPINPDFWTKGEPRRLNQILTNLIGNAIAYTEKGGVVISCRSEENWVCIDVSDTGVGIPADRLDFIFEPFKRVETVVRGRHPQGHGVGLTICRDLARVMGGDVTVKSEIGKGSTFTLRLPLYGPPLEGTTSG